MSRREELISCRLTIVRTESKCNFRAGGTAGHVTRAGARAARHCGRYITARCRRRPGGGRAAPASAPARPGPPHTAHSRSHLPRGGGGGSSAAAHASGTVPPTTPNGWLNHSPATAAAAGRETQDIKGKTLRPPFAPPSRRRQPQGNGGNAALQHRLLPCQRAATYTTPRALRLAAAAVQRSGACRARTQPTATHRLLGHCSSPACSLPGLHPKQQLSTCSEIWGTALSHLVHTYHTRHHSPGGIFHKRGRHYLIMDQN